MAAVKAAGITVRSTPIVYDPGLYVLKHTVAPAVLLEQGFHTNQGDVANLKDAAYRQRLAEAEAKGILTYLGIPWKEDTANTDFERAIQWVRENGIMLGNTDGDMMLDQPVTRKQFAVMLYRYHEKFGR